MVSKLPKEILEKLTAEDIDVIKKTFDDEAGAIRKSSQNGMVPKKEFDATLNELNSLKRGNEVDKLLNGIPNDLHDLFRDKLISSENLKEDFDKLVEAKKGLIEKLSKDDTPASVSTFTKPPENNNRLTPEQEKRLEAGLPIL